jgi:cytochrome P450
MGKFIASKGSKIVRKTKRLARDALEQFGENMFSSFDEEIWKHHRNTINPAFSPDCFANIAEMTKTIVKTRLFPSIEKKAASDPQKEMGYLSLDVIGQ